MNDGIILGAGHNSLVAAAYLSKAGQRCLVLEGRSVLGGNVVTEELTLPGFRHDSCGTAHVILQDNPMMRNDELGLVADYGLEYIHPEIVCHAPFLDGSYLTQYHDIERTIEQFGKFPWHEHSATEQVSTRIGAAILEHARVLRRGKTLQERRAQNPHARTERAPMREGFKKSGRARNVLKAWISRKKFVAAHTATTAFESWPEFGEMLGARYDGARHQP
jgi:phytoene dehydrogenase-like protein